MIRSLPFLLALSLAACSYGGPENTLGGDLSSETAGTLLNQAPETIYWLALDFETSTRADPAPRIVITDDTRDRVLVSGGTAPLTVENYRQGEDFVLWLYRIEDETALFTSVQHVDAGDFERDGKVVTVTGF